MGTKKLKLSQKNEFSQFGESLQKKSVGEVPLTQTQRPAFEFPKTQTRTTGTPKPVKKK